MSLGQSPDPADRRVTALALTDDGRQLRDAFWRRLTSDPGPIAPLTPIQVRQLGELLEAALEQNGFGG